MVARSPRGQTLRCNFGLLVCLACIKILLCMLLKAMLGLAEEERSNRTFSLSQPRASASQLTWWLCLCELVWAWYIGLPMFCLTHLL